MLTKGQLYLVNELVESVSRIDEILRGMESKYVETTIGLVDINSASKHEVKSCDRAKWLHCDHEDIEKELKARCRELLIAKKAALNAKLSEYIEI